VGCHFYPLFHYKGNRFYLLNEESFPSLSPFAGGPGARPRSRSRRPRPIPAQPATWWPPCVPRRSSAPRTWPAAVATGEICLITSSETPFPGIAATWHARAALLFRVKNGPSPRGTGKMRASGEGKEKRPSWVGVGAPKNPPQLFPHLDLGHKTATEKPLKGCVLSEKKEKKRPRLPFPSEESFILR